MRETVGALLTLSTIVRAGSFSQAARDLDISQPSLSEAIRKLEATLGVRLLERTSRGVSATPAGERLLRTIEPHLEGIGVGLDGLRGDGYVPGGKVRIALRDETAEGLVVSILARVLRIHPTLEIDIARVPASGDPCDGAFDAEVCRGETLGRDLVSIRMTPDTSMVVVGSPEYLKTCARPATPVDLLRHLCIARRDEPRGDVVRWTFRKEDRVLNVDVPPRLTVSSASLALSAALGGAGLAHLPQPYVRSMLDDGRLRRVLDDWSTKLPGHFLRHSSRRAPSQGLTLVIDALLRGI